MSTISAQVSLKDNTNTDTNTNTNMLQDCFTCILQLKNIEVLFLQNDLSLATAFEGDDIPSFGVFTDHQVFICFLCCSSVILFCYDFQK